MLEKSQVLLTAIREEFKKELDSAVLRDVAQQILEPHSKLKKVAKLLKKAEELNQAILYYRDPPRLAIKKKPAA
jgi:hypothetical protein